MILTACPYTKKETRTQVTSILSSEIIRSIILEIIIIGRQELKGGVSNNEMYIFKVLIRVHSHWRYYHPYSTTSLLSTATNVIVLI